MQRNVKYRVTRVKLSSMKQEMYLKQQRATKASIVAFYKLHKPE